MKKFSKMSAEELEEVLITASEEVQELCGFDPPIKTKGKNEKQLIKKLKEAYGDLTVEDKVSKQSRALFDHLGFDDEPEEEEEEEEEEETKSDKKSEKKDSKKEKGDKKDDKKAEKKEPKEKVISMATIIDELVEKGGKWETLCKKANEVAEERGKNGNYTTGILRAHINYRVSQDKKWLKSRDLELNDKGVTKS